MSRSPRKFLAGLLVLAIACHRLRASGNDAVAVSALADRHYTERKFSEPGKPAKTETYVFAQGDRYAGKLVDRSLSRTDFGHIARVLAPALALHRFQPAGDPKAADLLIVVHWGISSVEANADHGQIAMAALNADLAAYNASAARGGVTDPSQVNADLDQLRGNAPGQGSDSVSNADLLGFAPALKREEYRSAAAASGMTELDRTLRHSLSDERYFVILMAYDLKAARSAGKGRKSKLTLLWSAHVSMTATGRNFEHALPAMSQAAAHFLGTNSEGLLLDAARVRSGTVQIGEPRVVNDPVPDTASKSPSSR